jgi:hypothetical protein
MVKCKICDNRIKRTEEKIVWDNKICHHLCVLEERPQRWFEFFDEMIQEKST